MTVQELINYLAKFPLGYKVELMVEVGTPENFHQYQFPVTDLATVHFRRKIILLSELANPLKDQSSPPDEDV